jgi:hypothetical protein
MTGGYRDYSDVLLRECAAERLNRLRLFAAGYGVRINVETAGECDRSIAATMDDMKTLMEAVDGCDIGVVVNVRADRDNDNGASYAERARGEAEQWIQAFGDKVTYLRFHDPIGRGCIVLVRPSGYNGAWGVCVSDESRWYNPAKIDDSLWGARSGERLL